MYINNKRADTIILQENLRDNYSGDPNNEPLNNGLLIVRYSDA